jgi:hypothetical protein
MRLRDLSIAALLAAVFFFAERKDGIWLVFFRILEIEAACLVDSE